MEELALGLRATGTFLLAEGQLHRRRRDIRVAWPLPRRVTLAPLHIKLMEGERTGIPQESNPDAPDHFSPSDRLVNLVLWSASERLEEKRALREIVLQQIRDSDASILVRKQAANKIEDVEATPAAVRGLLEERVPAFVRMYANSFSHVTPDRVTRAPLTQGGAFTQVVANALVKRFGVSPRLARDFLETLFRDLLSVAKNQTLCGPWGRLLLDSGNLYVESSPRVALSQPRVAEESEV